MTHQQILQKAIQKAIDGGWPYDVSEVVGIENRNGETLIRLRGKRDLGYYFVISLNGIIFNHDFAKALWATGGTEEHPKWKAADNCSRCNVIDGSHVPYTCWETHLQQMVISEDPIKYLGENI